MVMAKLLGFLGSSAFDVVRKQSLQKTLADMTNPMNVITLHPAHPMAQNDLQITGGAYAKAKTSHGKAKRGGVRRKTKHASIRKKTHRKA